MRKILFSMAVFAVIQSSLAQPLPARLSHTVIIDTDCGIDDMRAISLLLARPEIKIKAVLTSDGSLPPSEGAEKVCALLQNYGKEDIPVAYGDNLGGVNPPWRPFNRSVNWGDKNPSFKCSVIKNTDYLQEALLNESEKITLICLGPLTNIATALKRNSSLSSVIERIVWYNESLRPVQGFNYECDKESADVVLNSKVRIDVISNLGKTEAFFDTSMFNVCRQSETQLARALYRVFSQPAAFEKLKENHFRLSDDLVTLYVTNPELFDINTMTGRLGIRYNEDYNSHGVREAITDMINGNYYSEHNVVFNSFPADRRLFNYDVRPIIDSAIARYGLEEWKANVMTDEFHGHLGVFSIVGAKMGIRARELFGVGPDVLNVVTFAGTKPPYSCLNDGIQVSTGATLGMGTIKVASGATEQPAAVFTYKNRSIRIALKNEYLEKVDADIEEGIVKFGLLDDGYWKLVRRNALKYWLEWDRHKIFEVEEAGPK